MTFSGRRAKAVLAKNNVAVSSRYGVESAGLRSSLGPREGCHLAEITERWGFRRGCDYNKRLRQGIETNDSDLGCAISCTAATQCQRKICCVGVFRH